MRGSASRRVDDTEGDVGEVVPARDRVAVHETEPLAPADRQAVELNVARRSRDLARRDGGRGSGHVGGVLGAAAHPVVGDSAASPAGIDSVGTTAAGRSHLLGRMLRCEPHVRVVREDDRLVRLELLEAPRRARPWTGSPSGRPRRRGSSPTPSARVSNNARFPACDHRDDSALRARGRHEREAAIPPFLLLVHVGDLDSLDRARGGAERERRAGVVGVDVHFQRGLVSDHHERVAELLELRLEPVAVERLSLDHEDGAVAVAGRLEMDGLDARRRLGGRRCRQRLARDRAGQSPAGARRARRRPRRRLPRRAGSRVVPACARRPPPRAARARRAGRRAARTTSVCRSASSASSRMTESIVPSTGRRTAR